MQDMALQFFLSGEKSYYLNSKEGVTTLKSATLDFEDIVLYKIESITYKKDAPRREALENVISALRIDGLNFIYLILGSRHQIEFYYGISKDCSKQNPNLCIAEIGDMILDASIRGNFNGSRIQKIDNEKKEWILQRVRDNQYQSAIEGVPGILKDEDEFQGVDRLANIMTHDGNFGFMIVASLLEDRQIACIEKNIFDFYSKLAPIAKQNLQNSTSKNYSNSQSKTDGSSANQTVGTNSSSTKGSSETKSKSQTNSVTEGKSQTISKNKAQGISETARCVYGNSGVSENESTTRGSSSADSENRTCGRSKGESYGTSKSQSEGTSQSKTEGTNQSRTEGSSEGSSNSVATTTDLINKQAQDWMQYIDEILLPRIDYGKGKGIFISSIFCFADSEIILKKLENTIITLFSGENGNKIPLRAFLLDDGKRLESFRNFQIPRIQLKNTAEPIHSLLSQSPNHLGNWISTKELSLIAGLPKKDVIGLELREEVEFGLNFPQVTDSESLVLGRLMQSGNITNKDVGIAYYNLDKHIFITGVTGSGKTTTCQNILIKSNLPFLVIEPAKTEYRILKDKYEDLLIFTLGKDAVAPFRLNPFEFFPHESITSRVDMIKASIEAAFDMEAAIPQIIESAIYECYKERGWNIATNQNEIYGESAFDDGVYSFPTLGDLIEKVEEVVKNQGFDDRLKNDYIGSIRARLNGLLVGSKGFMLNTKRSIDFRQLLSKRVVLEIEEIRNGSEKSLIMGFVLGNVVEAIKANFSANHQKSGVRHIILIEEAHRLLSKFQVGDSPNKKQGVEVFADMLAEIRKYGECLMIADQIPNKLTPEVLKNTNTKIVHRLFAEDDKRAIANTMALEEEQKEFLSKLDAGVAVVFSGGFNKAIATKISQTSDTTSNLVFSEDDLQKSVYKFYAHTYKNGVILGSSWLENVGVEKIARLLDLQRRGGLMKEIKKHWLEKQKIAPKLLNSIQNFTNDFSLDFLSRYFLLENNMSEKKIQYAKEFLEKYLNDGFNEADIRYFNDELF